MDKRIDSVLRELWASTQEAMAQLSARDKRFAAWSLKSGHISYNDNSAYLRFKNPLGRTVDASISLVEGIGSFDEQLEMKLQMLVS